MADRHFDPRAMMQRAIEVMLQSVPESRADGKASPKVGAVLIPPAVLPSFGSMVTAYRGELREGDHAEYALLVVIGAQNGFSRTFGEADPL